MPDVLPTMTGALLGTETQREIVAREFVPQATTKRFTVPVKIGSVSFRAVAYVPGLRRSLLATSTAFQLKAEVPIILPDGGEYEVVKEVRILATTDADGDTRAVIHYTLDGTVQILKSTKCSDFYIEDILGF
jgi:hypothetical protein